MQICRQFRFRSLFCCKQNDERSDVKKRQGRGGKKDFPTTCRWIQPDPLRSEVLRPRKQPVRISIVRTWAESVASKRRGGFCRRAGAGLHASRRGLLESAEGPHISGFILPGAGGGYYVVARWQQQQDSIRRAWTCDNGFQKHRQTIMHRLSWPSPKRGGLGPGAAVSAVLPALLLGPALRKNDVSWEAAVESQKNQSTESPVANKRWVWPHAHVQPMEM
ncbi:hypothetical protein V2G26_000642 [Clonostachys chloroleuca]